MTRLRLRRRLWKGAAGLAVRVQCAKLRGVWHGGFPQYDPPAMYWYTNRQGWECLRLGSDTIRYRWPFGVCQIRFDSRGIRSGGLSWRGCLKLVSACISYSFDFGVCPGRLDSRRIGSRSLSRRCLCCASNTDRWCSAMAAAQISRWPML